MSEGSAMILRRSKGLFLRNSDEGNDAANFTARNFGASAGAQRSCQRAYQSHQRRIATHLFTRDENWATLCTMELTITAEHRRH
jgi:hypothetical protein